MSIELTTKERCEKKVLETLEYCLVTTQPMSINYYNSDISDAFHKFVKPVTVGNVQVGYEYKGHLLVIEPTRYDCEYAVINKGKI